MNTVCERDFNIQFVSGIRSGIGPRSFAPYQSFLLCPDSGLWAIRPQCLKVIYWQPGRSGKNYQYFPTGKDDNRTRAAVLAIPVASLPHIFGSELGVRITSNVTRIFRKYSFFWSRLDLLIWFGTVFDLARAGAIWIS
jgi:hypothetical protein